MKVILVDAEGDIFYRECATSVSVYQHSQLLYEGTPGMRYLDVVEYSLMASADGLDVVLCKSVSEREVKKALEVALKILKVSVIDGTEAAFGGESILRGARQAILVEDAKEENDEE